MAEDWKGFAVPGWAVKRVDLWRFLDCCPMEMSAFGTALNVEAAATEGRKVLLGYSMGGRLALEALLAGGPWDAAVLVSAHAGLETETERISRRKLDAEWAARALEGDWADFLKAWNAQGVLETGRWVRAMADRSLLAQRRRSVARSFMDWSLGTQTPRWDRLKELKLPLLWVAGEKDGKFRDLAARAVESGGFEMWTAPGVGHRVPWESPEFPGMIGEFLERAIS